MAKFTLSEMEVEFIVDILKDWKEGLIEMKLKQGRVAKIIKKLENRLIKLKTNGRAIPSTSKDEKRN